MLYNIAIYIYIYDRSGSTMASGPNSGLAAERASELATIHQSSRQRKEETTRKERRSGSGQLT